MLFLCNDRCLYPAFSHLWRPLLSGRYRHGIPSLPDTDNTVLLVGLVLSLPVTAASWCCLSPSFLLHLPRASGMIATTADWIVSLSRNCISYKPAVLGLTAVIFLVSSTGVSNVLKDFRPALRSCFPDGRCVHGPRLL